MPAALCDTKVSRWIGIPMLPSLKRREVCLRRFPGGSAERPNPLQTAEHKTDAPVSACVSRAERQVGSGNFRMRSGAPPPAMSPALRTPPAHIVTWG